MKMTILTALAIMVTGISAHAKMACSVLSESKPGNYDKFIATVDYDGVTESQTILEENGAQYQVGRDGNGALSLSAYAPSTQKIYAYASAKTEDQLLVMAPEIKRILVCVKSSK